MTPGQPISERQVIEVPKSVYQSLRVDLTETIRWNGTSYYLRARTERREPGCKTRYFLEVEL